MLGKRKSPSPIEAADLIDRFVQGAATPHEWGDFESLQGKTPELESIRQRVVAISQGYPPRPGFPEWASPAGVEALRALANDIRASASEVRT